MAMRFRLFAAAGAVALVLAGCVGEPSPPTSAPATNTPSSAAGPQTPSSTTATTLRTLIEAPPESPQLVMIEQLLPTDLFTSSVVSFVSDGLTIRGVLDTPMGEPATSGVVFVHGADDPSSWSGQTGYVREQGRLARAGYAVLVPDLRNYGESDQDPEWQTDLEMGTTLDVINATRALTAQPGIERVAIVGHSLGGAMTLNALVVAPGVADAFVALAPSNPSAWVNVEHFTSGTPYFDDITALRGTIEDNPQFWADVDATTFASRATAPLLIVQGSADDVVVPDWARQTATAFGAAGSDVELEMVPGADHLLDPKGDEAWALVLAFLAETLTR